MPSLDRLAEAKRGRSIVLTDDDQCRCLDLPELRAHARSLHHPVDRSQRSCQALPPII